ncbi:2Fe-2S iron-sulfur cluster-binding protein [Myxococcota bacterium]|nr:2Fe-2S iron-sulfur cluster-binding protein [Myxococcota bacterium]
MPLGLMMSPLAALRRPAKRVGFTLDGRPCSTAEGTSILDAADAVGVWIPRLCHLPGAPARAVCRLCLVEVEGAAGPIAACATAVREGMTVATDTPNVRALRRTIAELTLMEHGRCGRPGCEVEALAERLGAALPDERVEKHAAVEGSAYLGVTLDRCVRCDRCIRACRAGVIARSGDGASLSLSFDGRASVAESRCTACGDCIAVCPGGALEGPLFEALTRGPSPMTPRRAEAPGSFEDQIASTETDLERGKLK